MRKRCAKIADRVGSDHRTELVAFLEDEIVGGDHDLARAAAYGGDADAAGLLDFADAPSGIARAHDRRDRGELSEIERMLRIPGGFQQYVADELRADGRRTDRLHAELAVHLAARRIVDARDDSFDLEHALRDQGGHDIAVVAVGYGDKAIGRRGAGALEHVVVDPGSDDLVTFELWSKPLECGGVFVDDDDFVPVGVEEFCERRSDAPAPDDQVSHEQRPCFRARSVLPLRFAAG